MSPVSRVTLEIILQTAAEIADTDGFNEITLATISKKLQIRTPSLYNHIDGLQQLRNKLSIFSMEKLYNNLIHSTVGVAGDDAVRSLCKTYIEFTRRHPGLYESTFSLANSDNIELQKSSSKILDLLVRILNYYNLDTETSLHVTRGLRSILHGFSSLEQKGGFGIPLDVDDSFKVLIDIYLKGLHSIKERSTTSSSD